MLSRGLIASWKALGVRLSYSVEMVDQTSAHLWELSDLFPTDTRHLLVSLGWDSVPSREQTYHEIEERLLLPKERLPEDWLAKYQVWVKRTTPLRH